MIEIENKQNPSNTDYHNAENEIDFVTLLKIAWGGRKIILKITLVFFLIGIFIAVFSPKKYAVTTVMVPQISGGQNRLGGLSSLAAMAGFNLNLSNSGSELSPMFYSQIVQSIPFQKELMYAKLNFKGYYEKISLYDYYTDPQYAKFEVLKFTKKYSIGLPGTVTSAITRLFKNSKSNSDSLMSSKDSVKSINNIIQLSSKDRVLIGYLNSNVYLNMAPKDGSISITAIMPEALAAAQLGQSAQEILQQYITKLKTKKIQAQLNFVEELYHDKKEIFIQSQIKLARFRDQNKNVSTSIARTEEERLQSEYQISQSVYNELAKQLENSRIKLKEETPVFSIIQPISIPNKNFKPKPKNILFVWIFLGGIVSFGWVFAKHYFKLYKKIWIEK